MGSKVEDLIDALRRIVSHWVVTTTPVTVNAFAGDTILTVDSTLRFTAGDEFVLRNDIEDTEPSPGLLYINDILDNNRLELTAPLQLSWPLSATPSIFKTIKGQYVKRIFFGEPAVISQNDLPCVTVNMTTRSSEWLTTLATKERYNVEIGIFVEDNNYEDASRILVRLTDLIQAALKHNVFPLINDYDITSVTANISAGDEYIKVHDSSIFDCGNRILIETKYAAMESLISQVVDANTVKINPTADRDYLVTSGAQMARMRRFIHNSWPADINYGQISKGTLTRASVISYFAEEFETQFQGSWFDPQLK